MKNPSILLFLVFIFSVLYLASSISSYHSEMRTILFGLAGLAGLGIIGKLFGGPTWGDKAIEGIEKKKRNYDKAVDKLTAKQKKREERKEKRKKRRRRK